MTKNEATILLGLLEDLTDTQSTAGCNDLTLEDTPENRQLVEAAEKESDPDHEGVNAENGKIYTNDLVITYYLKDLIKTEYLS